MAYFHFFIYFSVRNSHGMTREKSISLFICFFECNVQVTYSAPPPPYLPIWRRSADQAGTTAHFGPGSGCLLLLVPFFVCLSLLVRFVCRVEFCCCMGILYMFVSHCCFGCVFFLLFCLNIYVVFVLLLLLLLFMFSCISSSPSPSPHPLPLSPHSHPLPFPPPPLLHPPPPSSHPPSLLILVSPFLKHPKGVGGGEGVGWEGRHWGVGQGSRW